MFFHAVRRGRAKGPTHQQRARKRLERLREVVAKPGVFGADDHDALLPRTDKLGDLVHL